MVNLEIYIIKNLKEDLEDFYERKSVMNQLKLNVTIF